MTCLFGCQITSFLFCSVLSLPIPPSPIPLQLVLFWEILIQACQPSQAPCFVVCYSVPTLPLPWYVILTSERISGWYLLCTWPLYGSRVSCARSCLQVHLLGPLLRCHCRTPHFLERCTASFWDWAGACDPKPSPEITLLVLSHVAQGLQVNKDGLIKQNIAGA